MHPDPQLTMHLSPPSAAVVELNGIHKHYRLGQVTVAALHDIQLTIGAGEFAALWGPSGSGKTSLLNIIGLIDTPTGGQLKLAGQDPARLNDRARARLRNHSIGYVFQHFNLIPVLSALENVALPLSMRGMSRRQAQDKAAVTLEQVGLASKLSMRPDALSGGQRQRVALARALVIEPALVVADEPTANLDAATGEAMIQLMRDINRQRGVTFLFSTHDPRLIHAVDRLIRLADGRLQPTEEAA
ncbi:putative ABC transport system ATP-binding protein [Chitinivorax tropicus]|uniref:Putative ABC transport system ATP-binding protein n=1 Tax=Chitinivorax tropicus TaxID=714531 RepID=A0A840MDM4_9PROT|nr:ABC transporter ATP-binding protein [Chitinivorax tropicus]MBB5017404.1 putative ABC transport system ATP-binding protein [Chitinivorax tropicus]